jgi:ParB family chromosome partitioning protein
MKKPTLGRGLADLLGQARPSIIASVPAAAQAGRVPADELAKLPLDLLQRGRYQPRADLRNDTLGELAESIKAQGVIQPIVVRPLASSGNTSSGGAGEQRYEIIAGERRWRAAQIASLHEVPIVPIDVSDSDALEIMIIENVQREDLNAMEEAQGYHALADEFKRSQEDIAKEVGKSRSHVANMMRLTKLPAEVQAFIASGQLTAGHARALIGVPDPVAAAKRIVEEGLNVRQTEALAHEEGVPERKPQKARAAGGGKVKDPDTIALEKRVSDALGLAVTVSHRDPGGSVQISYRNLEQLDEVMRRLAKGG